MSGLPRPLRRRSRTRPRPGVHARRPTGPRAAATGGADPDTDVDRAAPDLDFDVDLLSAFRVLRGGQ